MAPLDVPFAFSYLVTLIYFRSYSWRILPLAVGESTRLCKQPGPSIANSSFKPSRKVPAEPDLSWSWRGR